MMTDEALQHAAKELPEGWEIEVTATSGLGVGVELVEWDRVEWSWGHDPSAPLAENILRAVAWAKEQVK